MSYLLSAAPCGGFKRFIALMLVLAMLLAPGAIGCGEILYLGAIAVAAYSYYKLFDSVDAPGMEVSGPADMQAGSEMRFDNFTDQPITLMLDGEPLGVVAAGGTAVYRVAPGHHTVDWTADGESGSEKLTSLAGLGNGLKFEQ